MPNLNKVMLMGNITRDPELKYTPKGTAIADFGLAINRNWKTETGEKREETTFVGCVAFGRVAEIIGEYCKKGNPLYVEGRLTQESWNDKTSGEKKSKTKVMVENIQFLGGKPQSTQREEPPPQRRAAPHQPPRPPADPYLDADDSENPFVIPFIAGLSTLISMGC